MRSGVLTIHDIAELSTNLEPHASDAQDQLRSSNSDEQENDDLDPEIVTLVKEFVGHSISHLSHAQIKKLLDSMPETQASSLETQARPPPVCYLHVFNRLQVFTCF